MQTFSRVAAQGEITLIRISDTPAAAPTRGYTPLPAENGMIIVGHSETGHHHVMVADKVQAFTRDTTSEGMRILQLIVAEPTKLEHLRPNDTHDSILLPAGTYEVRIGREYDPYAEIARQTQD